MFINRLRSAQHFQGFNKTITNAAQFSGFLSYFLSHGASRKENRENFNVEQRTTRKKALRQKLPSFPFFVKSFLIRFVSVTPYSLKLYSVEKRNFERKLIVKSIGLEIYCECNWVSLWLWWKLWRRLKEFSLWIIIEFPLKSVKWKFVISLQKTLKDFERFEESGNWVR